MRPIARGDRGLPVSDVQKRLHDLGFSPPGFDMEMRESRFGESTEQAVREFQAKRGLRVDGRVDETTWRELVEASFRLGDRFLYLRIPPFRGDDVRKLQEYLNRLGFNAGREDGIFGQETDRALRAFQHDMGLPVDGIAGSSTISCLLRLRRVMKETSVAVVHEGLRDISDRGLEGRRVVLDLAEAGADTEEALSRAADTAEKMGFSLAVFRCSPRPPDESERARLANQEGADLVIGFRKSERDDVQLFYFGGKRYFSPRGRRLAELLALEISRVWGGAISPPEGKSFPLLRETRMPCVIVEWPASSVMPQEMNEALSRALAAYFLPDEGRESGM